MEDTRPTPPPSEVDLTPVRAFLSDLLRRIDPGAEFVLSQTGTHIGIHLRGALGFKEREGAGIQALEHLADLYLRRHLRGELRIQVDIDDFRQRRTTALIAQAQASAQEVLTHRKAFAFEPMTAWERKIVHEVLEGVEGVRTFSRGSLERHVVVEPVSAREKRPRKRRDA